MTHSGFFHKTAPAPSDQEFSDWLEQSGIRWISLNAGERNTVKNLFIKQRTEDFDKRSKKASPLIRKTDFIGKPKLLAPSTAISTKLHQRVIKNIKEASTPNTKTFFNVSAPKMSGTVPYLILQGKTLIIVDARNWEASKQYTISKDLRVMTNGGYFDKGSISLPFYTKAWKDMLPKDFKVLGMVALIYGEADFTKNPESPSPFIITDLPGMKKVMRQVTAQDEYSDKVSLYVSTLLMRYM